MHYNTFRGEVNFLIEPLTRDIVNAKSNNVNSEKINDIVDDFVCKINDVVKPLKNM